MAGIKIELKMGGLGAVPASAKQRVDRALAAVAHLVEADAKSAAPVDTGALKNSIQTRRVRSLEHEVAVGVEYGAYVEFGTVRMGARPYLTPAVERQRAAFERIVGEAIRSAIEEAEV